jgi:5'-phosphate synthase pdxT subunit
VRRNGYGRQVDSFEDNIPVEGLGDPFHAVFIRAPKVEAISDDVTVLASRNGVPVLVRQGNVLGASFHPELTDDDRLHSLFLELTGPAAPALT